MYCAHFGFSRPPFNNTPDPVFYYGTPDHEEALATLEYATFQRKGFVLVTGEIGAGKTLISRLFLQKVEPRANVAVIHHAHLTGRQLLAAICREFELDVPPEADNLQHIERLETFLLEQFAGDRYAVVLLDEAQNLSDEAFEELRMLGNLEADDAKLLQVCILGQPELRVRFSQPGLRQIGQRLFRRFHLHALDRAQCEQYILHRLKVAGCNRPDLFTTEAVSLIFSASAGIPRIVNHLCDNALLAAYGQEHETIDAATVQQVLEQEEAASAPSHPDASGNVVQPAAEQAVLQTVTESATIELNADPVGIESNTDSAEAMPADHAREIDLPQTVRDVVRQMDELASCSQAAADAARAAKESTTQSRAALKIVQTQAIRLREARQMVRAVDERTHRTDNALEALADRTRQQWETMADQVRESHARTQGEFSEQLRTTTEKMRGDFEDRIGTLDRSLHSLDELTHRKLDELTAALERLEDERPSTEMLETIRQQHTEAIDALRARLEERYEEVRSLQQSLAEHAAAHNERHAEDISEISRRVEGYTRRLLGMRHKLVGDMATLTRRLDALAETAVTRAQLEQLAERHASELHSFKESTRAELARVHEHQQASADNLRREHRLVSEQIRDEQTQTAEQLRGEQQSAVHMLREEHIQITDELRREQQETAGQMRDEQTQTAEQLRGEQRSACRELLDRHVRDIQTLCEDYKRDLAVLNRNRAADTDAILDRIGSNRRIVKRLVGGVVERFRATQRQLATLEASSASRQELADLHTRQEAESQKLLQQLESQAGAIQEQFERMSDRVQQAYNDIESLRATTARSDDIERLLRLAAEDREYLKVSLAAQQRDLELLADGLGARCDALLHRLDALPADLATTRQLDEARRAYTEQVRDALAEMVQSKAQLEESISRLAAQGDQTHAELERLAAEAATTRDVEALRDQQEDKIAQLVQRIDLHERHYGHNLHDLSCRVAEHTRRVTALEELERPQPVRIELSPQAGTELGDLIESAHRQHEQLAPAVERAETLASQLEATRERVGQSLDRWDAQADQIDARTDKLRKAAESARQVIDALSRCHRSVQSKLDSKRWQTELTRGEALSQRLEQATDRAHTVVGQLQGALHDFERCQNTADQWDRRHAQARQTVRQLADLLDEAARVGGAVDQNLNRRKKMLEAVAQNTAKLMKVIEAARQDDVPAAGNGHKQHPARLTDRTSPHEGRPETGVHGIDWPVFRMRPPRPAMIINKAAGA